MKIDLTGDNLRELLPAFFAALVQSKPQIAVMSNGSVMTWRLQTSPGTGTVGIQRVYLERDPEIVFNQFVNDVLVEVAKGSLVIPKIEPWLHDIFYYVFYPRVLVVGPDDGESHEQG